MRIPHAAARVRAARAIVWLLALALGASALVGCTAPSVEFSVADTPYTLSQMQLVMDRADVSGVSDRSVADAIAIRRRALARLRGEGEAEAEAADFVTDVLPPESASVPVYIEKADVDGVPSYIVVEAWGARDGQLDRKRLWVLDAVSGDVIFSAAGR